jgi:hypothetical protein
MQSSFPIGSPANALRERLEAEGFRIETRSGREHLAAFSLGTPLCPEAHLWVQWETDRKGAITKLSALEHGCPLLSHHGAKIPTTCAQPSMSVQTIF